MKIRPFINTFIIVVVTLTSYSCQKSSKENNSHHIQESYTADWASLKQHAAIPQWFSDAKLGVYFHWGVYSVPATNSEWYPRFMYAPDIDEKKWGHEVYQYHKDTYGEDFDYHDFIPMWKAPAFDAKKWVDMFEGMGAKFIGSIAEHHDGFSLWESDINEWNSFDMGPRIDVVKAIAEETKKRDLKFMATFHHGFHTVFYPKKDGSFIRPVSRHQYVYQECEIPTEEKYKKLYGQLSYEEEQELWLEKINEVVENHCPDYIWMDFGQRYIQESYRQQFLANYFNKATQQNKEVVVNTKGDFFPEELAVVNVERATMEDITPQTWVTDFIIGGGWCYNKDRRTAADPAKLIRILAEVVSKNGVMLLSAGPMADGTMPVEQVATMEGIGQWMQAYGEAIYDTHPFVTYGEGPTHFTYDPTSKIENGGIRDGLNALNEKDIRYTQKGNTVYAIQLGWDAESPQRTLNTFAQKNKSLIVASVEVLGSKEHIKWKQTKNGLEISQPEKKPASADIALVYKIELK